MVQFDCFYSPENKKDEEKRMFALEINGQTAKGIFNCGGDLYEAEYRLIDQDAFNLVYVCKGEGKDYVTETQFRRKK